MKTLIFKTFFILFVLLVSNARANSQVEFRLVQKFMIVVSVTINDAEQFDFLLDTGTNSTVITPEVAQKLNLRPRDRMELITVTGKQIVPRAFLPTVALGAEKVENVEVLIVDLPALSAIDKNICGVLGQNFLAHFNYLLDFDKRKITFDENGELENRLHGKQTRLETEESRLVVTVFAKQNKFRLVLDSGASNIIFFDHATRQLVNNQYKTSFAEISTNTGDGTVQITQLNSLHVGDKTFYDLPAVFIGEENEQRTEDGLLPLRLFRSVFFNNKNNYVIFNARPRK